MKPNYSSIILFLLLFCAFFSCKEDDFPDPNPDPFPSLEIFKERFLAEAKARGLSLDLSGVDLIYVDGDIMQNGEAFCGFGYQNYPSTGRRTVLISKSSRCGWATQSDLQRERFFFHEIGHAFVNLSHDDSFLCDGKPTSLMHSQVATFDYYQNDPTLKEYYLDELFDKMASEQKCIAEIQNFEADPVFFKHLAEDDFWFFYNAKGSFSGNRSNTTNSLNISSIDGKPSTETGYWYTQIDNPDIPEGAKVTLRTKVNSSGLKGPGVAIALRVYETELFSNGAQTTQSEFYSTENSPISGVLSDHILEVTIPNFTRKSEIFIPFAVMMPGTEGEVQFENFEILVEKQN
ncbi:hypothetical protein [Algoriphagus pacificus]|uniref:Dual-action HEIGH metallo-peptidase n=1 Tax=Algoriphagus pacificus TaxID=2811234 RepID=A0ABS3CE69_9BACT|nr:hypothetical protein [Algoriphagus pacificus]MBN7815406.1 hypothetical protein [Algoriphagus pacificus]